MNFIFEPIKISRNLRYTLGKETTTNKYYLSFLVSPANHRYVDYEKYYEILEEQFNLFIDNEDKLLRFIESLSSESNNSRVFRL